MNMRSAFRNGIVPMILALGAFYVAYWSYSPKVLAKQVGSSGIVVPIQARIIEKRFEASGKVGLIFEKRYSRFSDHTIVMSKEELYPSKHPVVTEILDTARDQRIYVDRDTNSVTTFHEAKDSVRSDVEGLPEESCADIDMGKINAPEGIFGDVKTIFGYRSYRYVVYPEKEWRSERWIVPELNCFALESIDRLGSGPYNTETVTELSVSEPAEDVRLVPSGFTERSPDEVEGMHLAKTGEIFWGSSMIARERRHYKNQAPVAPR